MTRSPAQHRFGGAAFPVDFDAASMFGIGGMTITGYIVIAL
ncbi:hypothetical protein [Streptosporangium canum]|nr:hypothetical protein [Streptosporangium canum]